MSAENDYEKDLVWISKTVPPDDIYDFALQLCGMMEYFFMKWQENVDILAIYNSDKTARLFIDNLVIFREIREKKLDVKWGSEKINENNH